MTENKNNQNTVDQDDQNKIKLTARGKKAIAVGKTALAIGLASAGVTAVASSGGEQSASAGSKQEQPKYDVDVSEPGDTYTEIAEKDLQERAADQPFAEEPTQTDIAVRAREIHGDSVLRNPDLPKDADQLPVGEEIYKSESSEVKIQVTPEVAPEDLPPKDIDPNPVPPPNPGTPDPHN